MFLFLEAGILRGAYKAFSPNEKVCCEFYMQLHSNLLRFEFNFKIYIKVAGEYSWWKKDKKHKRERNTVRDHYTYKSSYRNYNIFRNTNGKSQ